MRTPRVEAHSLLLFLATFSATASAFEEIHGCGGFVEVSSGLANSRKASDSKLDYSNITVDILGDEVDTLLGKIYIALDHYSPVLKHYPEVIEILKLVQKALKGESV